MIMKPAQLGREGLDPEALNQDRKHCRRFGPCGVGEKALYLNSFFLDCRYYIPYAGISRVFKRVAMSQGGFSHKGIFAAIPYLVVEYDGGQEKQCTFKREEHVDQLLEYLAQGHPEIKQLSASAEARLAARERERAVQHPPELSAQAKETLQKLESALEYLNKKPELSEELSQSARQKRTFLRSKNSYRWVAFAIMVLGLAALLYGIYAFLQKDSLGKYFILFGLAALFMFSGAKVMPTAKNNKKAVLARAEQAQEAMERYLSGDQSFPVPARYAHPIVLKRMCRIIEAGRASRTSDALEILKQDLKALNSSVEVDQQEHDEVVAIKAMFLNQDYQ